MPAVNVSSAKRIRTFFKAAVSATVTTALVTTGAGLVFSVSATTTATAGTNTFIALYDASATGTAVYNFVTTATGNSRLLCLFQATSVNSTGAAASISYNLGPHVFPEPIPFFDGLVVAETTFDAGAAGTCTVNTIVQLYAPRSL